MIRTLREIFERIRKFQLRLNGPKCVFGVTEIAYLGHILTRTGQKVDPSKIDAMVNFPKPTDQRSTRSFLGLTQYYKKFIEGYSKIAAPLNQLLRKDMKAKFEWTDDCDQAFMTLKQKLTTTPILRFIDLTRPFIITTDASMSAISWILSQIGPDGREHPCFYGGRSLHDSEKNYSITDKEGLALVTAIKEHSHILMHNTFTVYSDHISLTWLNSIKGSTGRLARWSILLQGYRFKVIHKAGKSNVVADALSRRSYPKETEQNISSKDAYNAHLEIGSELLCVVSDNNKGVEVSFDYETPPASRTTRTTGNVVASLEDVISQQQSCEDLKPIITYLTSGQLPADKKQATRLAYDSQYYVMENGALYHLYESRTKDVSKAKGVIRQLVVPTKLRAEVLKSLHDDNGHPGVSRFYTCLRDRYYWYGMFSAAEEYVKHCTACQKNKYPTNAKKAPLHPLQIDEIFGRYHIDLIGPLPETEPDNYRYILVLREATTYWVELYPLKTQSSAEIADKLLDCFYRFGPPRALLSDAAANLLSEIVQIICKIFKVQKITTSAYSQQTNSLCETFNKQVYQYLRVYCEDQTQWHRYLAPLAMAYRATPCAESHGFSPHFLLTGRDMLLPCDLNMTVSDKETYKSVDAENYVKQLLPRLELARKVAEENIKKHQQVYKEKYDRKGTREPEFPVGTKVLLFTPKTKLGFNRKMTTKYTGVFEVIEQLPNYTCRLRDCETGKEHPGTVHTNRLKKFYEKDEKQDEEQVISKTQETQSPPSDSKKSQPSEAATPQATQSDWYEIKRILQCQKRRGEKYYKVLWKQEGTRPEWVHENDVNDYAKSEFHRTRTWNGKLKQT
jgi:hypothetical protein